MPIFTMSNRHSPACGTPPAIDDAAGDVRYHGYFENRYGEQSLFVYDRDTGAALLYNGDAGWDMPYRVIDGRPEGLLLTREEAAWLAACWHAVRSRSPG